MRYVYILRNRGPERQVYVGVTSDLERRLHRHNHGECPHTSKFAPWDVVYVERFCDEKEKEAFARERQIKGWTRGKKEALICGDLGRLRGLARRRVF